MRIFPFLVGLLIISIVGSVQVIYRFFFSKKTVQVEGSVVNFRKLERKEMTAHGEELVNYELQLEFYFIDDFYRDFIYFNCIWTPKIGERHLIYININTRKIVEGYNPPYYVVFNMLIYYLVLVYLFYTWWGE